MKITKTDFLIISALIALSLMLMLNKGNGEKKLFLISNNVKKQIKLENQMIELHGGDVIIEVTKDGARFLKSDCSNQICVHTGWAKECGQTAVCVPNRYALVIECREVVYDAVSE
ncbi:hypothetical protein Dacet_1194 [Denitrovibrio acetiphilus DSM 12809]|uniref:Uncharacterized protein n=1 Tax=Denitrovibrio acetiphilus (strain DSM 12809 / NBRC 114555 / N2460) TaxID=522772 RepID=D4H7G7_DENA2|nr:NusG domain II-containing protein [Denitrovibrio acetiphilus]ADD67966.1 hypothetical protein Dacet_1194 [Denitrovibrio acetiphilus DSM 12809]